MQAKTSLSILTGAVGAVLAQSGPPTVTITNGTVQGARCPRGRIASTTRRRAPWYPTIPAGALSLLGSTHTAEIPFVFGGTDDMPRPRGNCSLTAGERALGATMMAAWDGNMFYLGPTTAGQYITRATYSLVPPAPPTDWAKADEDMTFLALWIGVQDNPNEVASVLNEDFVQPVLMWAPVQSNQGCPADVGHFCAATSTYTPQGQVQQPYTAVPSGATVDFEIALNASADKIDQRVYLNGELISEQSDSKGMRPAVFYSGNECYYEACGTLPEYSYTNITLVLNEADANLDQLLTLTNVTTTGFKTADKGVTWTCDSITIAKDDLTL